MAAIALIIGIGSGTYSGLTSVSEWRRTSYDESYDELDMYDLRITLAEGNYIDADELVDAARSSTGGDIDAWEQRLVEPTQVDASSEDEIVLVPGRLVGVDVTDGELDVNGIDITAGHPLGSGDRAELSVVLDENFAEDHELEPPTSIELTGGQEVDVVGRGLSPENFYVIGDGGSIFADFAVIYAPLATVQELTDHPNGSNDLVVRVAGGADVDEVEADLRTGLEEVFPDIGFTITPREEDRVLRILYDDIEGDQRFYNIFAVMILAGAAFAAFNLTVRIVESQRREIGIAMALGVPRPTIAIRTLLVGAQVALLGVLFGIGVGLLIGAGMSSLLRDFQPLPTWITDFQPGAFVAGALLGFVLPLVATLLPVWRAVRVTPVEAISTTHRARGGGLAPLVRRLPLPGSSVGEMPFRNVLREPRRTLLTALGIAAAITTLIGVLGMIDSFLATIDAGDDEILGSAPDRLTVDLDSFYAEDDAVVTDLQSSGSLRAAEPALQVGGVLAPETDGEIEILLSAVDLESDLWTPTTLDGRLVGEGPGLVLAEKAADDLGLEVGDTVVVRHPSLDGANVTLVDSEVPVRAIHPNPYRFVTYIDLDHRGLMNLEGIVNQLRVAPADGFAIEDVQVELFGRPGVASVEPVAAAADSIRDQIEEALGIFTIIEAAVLVLALLIAFNSTAINMDERAREHATMFAYGLPVRSVMRVAIIESLIVGVFGTLLGVLAGRLVLEWLIRVLVPDTLPDIGIVPSLAGSTVLTAVLLGVVAVAVAPLLTLRRLRRMDIPSTLRIVE